MRVEIDKGTKQLSNRLLFGGRPPRVLRLSEGGARAYTRLVDDKADSPQAVLLARRLINAGMAHPVVEPATGTDRVTIVIPVHNRTAEAKRMLETLSRSAPDVPVVVVDDSSTKPNLRALSRVCEHYDAQLVTHLHNRGPAAARNTGLATSDTEFVIFIDSDVELPTEPGWLEALLGHFTNDGWDRSSSPGVAAVAPRVEGRGDTTMAQRYSAAFCPLDLGPDQSLVGVGRAVSYVPSAVLLVSTRALADLDLPAFDAALRFGEDVDLVWRFNEAGWQVRYDPSVVVGHREPTSWSAVLRRRFHYGRSAAALDKRHPGATRPFEASAVNLVVVASAVVGQPVVAVATMGLSTWRIRRRLVGRNIPDEGLWPAVMRATTQTGLGLGRYLLQFWSPAVVMTLASSRVSRGTKLRLLALVLSGSILEVVKRRRCSGATVEWLPAHLADEVAYGAGVWSGAVSSRRWATVVARISSRLWSV